MGHDPLEKARALIELALSNPNENEARNAALKACKLIKQHDLLLKKKRAVTADSFWDDLFGNTAPDVEDPYVPPRAAGFATYGRPHVEEPAPVSPAPTMTADPGARRVQVMLPASCSICRQAVLRGHEAIVSNQKFFHEVCYVRATTPP